MTARKENLLNNAVFFFFALFLFSCSFSIALSQTSFGISLFLFLILSLLTRYNPFPAKMMPFYGLIAMFIFWLVVSAFVNGAPLRNLKEEWLFCVIPVGVYLFRQKHYRGVLLMSLAMGVLLVSIYGCVQHFTGVNLLKHYPLAQGRDDTFYAAGAFSNSLTYGNFMAVASLFLISLATLRSGRVFSLPQLTLITSGFFGFIGTVMSYSRTAVAALPIGFLSMTWLKGRKWAVYSVLILAVMAAITFFTMEQLAFKYELAFKEDLAGEQESSRLFIWSKSWRMALDNPLFGVGQGNFEKEYIGYLDAAEDETRSRPHAHNDFLNFAAVAGFPGAIFFIAVWIFWFYKLHNLWHSAESQSDKKVFSGAAAIAGVAFLVTSLTEATFADEEVRALLMVIWSAGLWPLLSEKATVNLPGVESA
jgi:O-antigen ligase